MAKVTGPLQSNDVRGKVGSLIFDRWRYLRTVRSFVPPENINTPSQVTARLVFKTLNRAWRNLSDINQAYWNSYARTVNKYGTIGVIVHPSGQNAFLDLNSHRLYFGLTQLNSPPLIKPMCFVWTLTDKCEFYPGQIAVQITTLGTPNPSDYYEIWQTYARVTQTRQPQNGDWYRVAAIQAITNLWKSNTEPVQLRSCWISLRYVDNFGQVTPFRKVFCKYYQPI